MLLIFWVWISFPIQILLLSFSHFCLKKILRFAYIPQRSTCFLCNIFCQITDFLQGNHRIIEKHENEIINCPPSFGKYKNDLVTGILLLDSELYEIDVIINDQKRCFDLARENQRKCDEIMLNGGDIDYARSLARLSVMYADIALNKVSDRLMDSCKNKVNIIGEVWNDVRVDDLKNRINICIRTREMCKKVLSGV